MRTLHKRDRMAQSADWQISGSSGCGTEEKHKQLPQGSLPCGSLSVWPYAAILTDCPTLMRNLICTLTVYHPYHSRYHPYGPAQGPEQGRGTVRSAAISQSCGLLRQLLFRLQSLCTNQLADRLNFYSSCRFYCYHSRESTSCKLLFLIIRAAPAPFPALPFCRESVPDHTSEAWHTAGSPSRHGRRD